MSITLSGDGTITGLTATGISAVQQLPAGSVLQVVNATYSTITSSTSASYADTGLTATITPKFSTSKILVIVVHNGVRKISASTYGNFKLLRGATEIGGTIEAVGSTNSTVNISGLNAGYNYLDSPATTSATTYKTQFNNQNATGTIYVNDFAVSATYSYITLLEIAA
jgi:hypothetical protein